MLTRKTAAFPASEAFDLINQSLQSDEAERKNAIKQGQAVFAFTLKNKAGETDSWHIDLKKEGVVAKGLGDKPTGTSYPFSHPPLTQLIPRLGRRGLELERGI